MELFTELPLWVWDEILVGTWAFKKHWQAPAGMCDTV